jgi:HK97 family phage major capsid protein
MEINAQMLQKLASELLATGLFASQHEVNKTLADLQKGSRSTANADEPSISKMIRGLQARKGVILNTATQEDDINYVSKTLTTSGTPGSYLVPTIQADKIIEILGRGGVLRASGATMWPMTNVQTLNIPTETAEPNVEYLAPNATQSASDPNFGQISLSLKTRRSLVAIPNELLKVSTPAVDAVITGLFGKAFAKSEDLAFFQGIASGPTSVLTAAGTTTINQAGANPAYTDLLAVLSAFSTAEGENGSWYIHPTVFFKKILGLVDSNNRPIVTGYNDLLNSSTANSAFVGQQAGNAGPVKFTLLGHPVYLSARIPTHVGSGSATSYILFTNPAYVHVGDDNGIEVAISAERFFDSNQTAIRAVSRHDFGYSNQAAIVLLENVSVS